MRLYGLVSEAGVEQGPTRDREMPLSTLRRLHTGNYRMAVPPEVQDRWAEVLAAAEELGAWFSGHTLGNASAGEAGLPREAPEFAMGTTRTDYARLGVRPFPELAFGGFSVWFLPAADLYRIDGGLPEQPENEVKIVAGSDMIVVSVR